MVYNWLQNLTEEERCSFDFFNKICESHHVIDSIHDCSKSICEQLEQKMKSMISDLRNNMSEPEFNKKYITPMFYSGWEYVGYETGGVVPQNFNTFQQSKNTGNHHNIFLAWDTTLSQDIFAGTMYRDMKLEKEIISKNITYQNRKSDIFILLNYNIIFAYRRSLEKLPQDNKETAQNVFYELISSTISHELDHASKEYLFDDENMFERNNKQGSIRMEFLRDVKNNKIKTYITDPEEESKLFDKIQNLLYNISTEEQAAHISGFTTVLKQWSNKIPSYLLSVIEEQYPVNIYHIFLENERNKEELQKKALCSTIANSTNTNVITGLAKFQSNMTVIDKLFFKEKTDYTILHILGYYVQKRYGKKELLKYYRWFSYLNLSEAGKFFKKETLDEYITDYNRKYTSDETDFLMAVQDWYKHIFDDYRQRIYKQMLLYYDDIRTQIPKKYLDISKVMRFLRDTHKIDPYDTVFEDYEIDESTNFSEIGYYMIRLL